MLKACEICNGTGQVSFFMGVSRFLLTWEECPECGGSGYREQPHEDESPRQEESAPPSSGGPSSNG